MQNIKTIESYSQCALCGNRYLLLTDTVVLEKIYPKIQGILPKDITIVTTAELPLIQMEMYSCIIGLGSGSILDSAKLYAKSQGIPWIAFPTRLTAAAFTKTASIKTKDFIKTVSCDAPQKILLSLELLHENKEHLLEEYLDSWSFQSAINDAIVAFIDKKERFDLETIFLANKCSERLKRISCFELDQISNFANIQAELAELINLTETTRYVSGSEHLIAHSLKKYGSTLSHGRLVGFGLLVSKSIQEEHDDIQSLANEFRYNNIRRNDLMEIFRSLSSTLAISQLDLTSDIVCLAAQRAKNIRTDRYTILNRLGSMDNLLEYLTE